LAYGWTTRHPLFSLISILFGSFEIEQYRVARATKVEIEQYRVAIFFALQAKASVG
jgi:hypothetical protein